MLIMIVKASDRLPAPFLTNPVPTKVTDLAWKVLAVCLS